MTEQPGEARQPQVGGEWASPALMRVCGRLPGNIPSRHSRGLGRGSPGGFCALGGDGIESVIYDGQGREGEAVRGREGGREGAGTARENREKESVF